MNSDRKEVQVPTHGSSYRMTLRALKFISCVKALETETSLVEMALKFSVRQQHCHGEHYEQY